MEPSGGCANAIETLNPTRKQEPVAGVQQGLEACFGPGSPRPWALFWAAVKALQPRFDTAFEGDAGTEDRLLVRTDRPV